MRSGGQFLNVDLEIGAARRADLAPLIDELRRSRLFELFVGRLRGMYRAHYEPVCPSTATAAIGELASVIDRLTPRARRAWSAARVRDFNVGVEVARGAYELAIEGDAVARVAALGGRIVLTAYPS